MENPKESIGYKEMSYTLQIIKKYDESLQYAEIVNKLNPEDAYGYFLKGQSYSQIGNPGKAIPNFEEAVRLKSNNNVYYNQLGLAYGEVQNYDKMAECFEKAFSISPKHIYLNNLGDAYIKKQDYAKAEDVLKRCIEMEPNYALGFCNLADVADILGKAEEALSYYGKAVELEPRNLVYRVRRGNLYKKLDRKQEALDDYETVLAISKDENSIGSIFMSKIELERTLKEVEQNIELLKTQNI